MAAESVEKLARLVDKALKDDAYAERVFREPDAIAQEQQLSGTERLVLRQMTRQQFETARQDAARRAATGELDDAALGSVAGGTAFSAGALGTAAKMILGRSVTAATGGSWSHLAGAGCECCAWKGKINMGAVVLPAD